MLRRRSGFRLRFHFCGQDGAQEAVPTGRVGAPTAGRQGPPEADKSPALRRGRDWAIFTAESRVRPSIPFGTSRQAFGRKLFGARKFLIFR